jgi:hypothetical protein
MQNRFKAPRAPLDADVNPSSVINWRSALLGAAVGVSGCAYFGTLTTNVALWVHVGQGRSVQEAYAHMGQFTTMLQLFLDAIFAFAGGWVSASHARERPVAQGTSAGLLAATFPLIMLASPAGQETPLLYCTSLLLISVFGSIVGGLVYSRRSPSREQSTR